MGCTLSGLNALYGADGIGDVWVNDNRFRILKLLHQNNGSSFIFLVKEVSDPSSHGLKVSSFASGRMILICFGNLTVSDCFFLFYLSWVFCSLVLHNSDAVLFDSVTFM